ncbi:bifunctional 4-hydroxy-2-oxoglutarate aldolase/2-dehydro-3-deoxy-phosphogluconate aldolase [Marinivivus vitaminiproducens]|nr:bifunctional 4-hydroxy-2-oxoglutarate aldolase/2-dehydro-3-deoxy-phosphogluconate aldolase [Geminicoccaceae bacterium SCSIO 64248]
MTQASILEIMQTAPVIPVLTIEDPKSAVALGRALVAGGLPVLEVTLRTPGALEAMTAMIAEIEGGIVGAGTVTTAAQADAVVRAGGAFIVSPGATDRLIDAARGWSVPFLPGAATASEVMRLADAGIVHQKFFPAEQAGGIPMLKALGAPLSGVTFCPTGGITPVSAPHYLALGNVACVGGSWVAPADAVKAGDWARITVLAGEASRLPRG